MKFLKIIEDYKSTLNEQDMPPAADIPGADNATPTEPEKAEPVEVDVPAGIATMGSLLKKALTLSISDDDRYKISQMPEINEKNANQVIKQLVAIMKSYSVDVDIDGNTNTSL